MALQPNDVTRIAQLARLQTSPAEAATMLEQLNRFFAIVERMSAVDTTGVEPLSTPLSALGDDALRLRDDVVRDEASVQARDRAQASAPCVEGGIYLVPRVVE